ncbi:UPF0389 protein CG9231 [Macrosteles quadrilineatus]|uniref:UPF0389 protein CG9231 n=1 Tax=Macrosteles quadrilineatus TaxID=74068 RepID=UPI0023E34AAA|nr:UPF0389 protein CG9231 [Macrosteles quadrilineatus]
MLLNINVMRVIRAARNYCSKNVGLSDKKQTIEEKVAGMSAQELVRNVIKVSDWNKRLLVFSGRYKSMKDVPDHLPFGTVDKERNRVRIKVANYMMIATVFGCLFTAWSGRKAAESGDSVEKRQLDWHKEYNEKAKKEEAAKTA